MSGFTTSILHSARRARPEHGAVHTPIHTSVAYGYDSAEALAAVFQNRAPGFSYARQGNPTAAALERLVTTLEGGVESLSFASGMAAIHALCLSLLKAGDHIVASRFLFGNTVSLFNTLAAFGVTVSFVDATDAAEVRAAITPATRLVFVETIANPVTQVADLAAIGALCAERGLVYVVDNTLTGPWLFQPRTVGASLVINALTKSFAGHGDALGGMLTDTGLYDWARFPNILELYKLGEPKRWALIQVRKKGLRDLGASLDAEAAHRILLGAETLALRQARTASNAQALAEFLEAHPAVEKVNYPGLKSHAQHGRAAELFRLPGSLLSFSLKAGLEPFPVLDRLRIAIISSNLGDNRTLVIPVAQTIFFELGAERRAAMGIPESLIRVSVGIEEPEDLLADFAQALTAVS
ncbi:MAG: cystathionine gamma-synthase family protein [Gammaproteobacteria bacterium]|nr:cystathionine gamma-synthase family protein [Gammaproteobacteria bacterium]